MVVDDLRQGLVDGGEVVVDGLLYGGWDRDDCWLQWRDGDIESVGINKDEDVALSIDAMVLGSEPEGKELVSHW